MSEVTDEMIVAARTAIERRQRSLIGNITKSSIRDALAAAEEVRQPAPTSVTVQFNTEEDAQSFVRTINWIGIDLATGRLWPGGFKVVSTNG